MSKNLLSTSGYISDNSIINKALCPVCQKTVKMAVIRTAIKLKISSLPRFKIRRRTIAVCTNCHAKLIPSRNALKQSRRHPNSLVWHDEFKIYDPYKGKLD